MFEPEHKWSSGGAEESGRVCVLSVCVLDLRKCVRVRMLEFQSASSNGMLEQMSKVSEEDTKRPERGGGRRKILRPRDNGTQNLTARYCVLVSGGLRICKNPLPQRSSK